MGFWCAKDVIMFLLLAYIKLQKAFSNQFNWGNFSSRFWILSVGNVDMLSATELTQKISFYLVLTNPVHPVHNVLDRCNFETIDCGLHKIHILIQLS